MQHSAGASLGKDSISAINLMDVSSKLAHVRRKHQECMGRLKVLWRTAAASKRDTTLARASELMGCFESLWDVVVHTDKCYADLILKFPGSASLHLDYAEFCEVVLNDPVKAANQRHGAELLEADGEGGDVEDRSQSRSNSTATSHKALQRQFVDSWLREVMGRQSEALGRLRWLVASLGLLLVIFSTCAFVIQDHVLLTSVTEARLAYLQRSLGYRQNAVRAGLYTRNLFLADPAATPGSPAAAAVAAARSSLDGIALAMSAAHSLNYVSPPSQACLDFFLREDLTERVAAPGRFQDLSVNFWDLMNHLVTAVAAAGDVGLEELQAADFSPDGMGVQKRAVAYLFDNLWTACPAMDRFFDQLSVEIAMLQDIIDWVVSSLLGVHLLCLMLFSYLVVRNVRQVFPTCQHAAIAGGMVHALPLSLQRKLLRYYLAGERSMAALADEATAKESLERGEDDHPPRSAAGRPPAPSQDSGPALLPTAAFTADSGGSGGDGPAVGARASRRRHGERQRLLGGDGGGSSLASESDGRRWGGGRLGMRISFAKERARAPEEGRSVRLPAPGLAPRRGSLHHGSNLAPLAQGAAISATEIAEVGWRAGASAPCLLPLTASNVARLAAQGRRFTRHCGGAAGSAVDAEASSGGGSCRAAADPASNGSRATAAAAAACLLSFQADSDFSTCQPAAAAAEAGRPARTGSGMSGFCDCNSDLDSDGRGRHASRAVAVDAGGKSCGLSASGGKREAGVEWGGGDSNLALKGDELDSPRLLHSLVSSGATGLVCGSRGSRDGTLSRAVPPPHVAEAGPRRAAEVPPSESPSPPTLTKASAAAISVASRDAAASSSSSVAVPSGVGRMAAGPLDSGASLAAAPMAGFAALRHVREQDSDDEEDAEQEVEYEGCGGDPFDDGISDSADGNHRQHEAASGPDCTSGSDSDRSKPSTRGRRRRTGRASPRGSVGSSSGILATSSFQHPAGASGPAAALRAALASLLPIGGVGGLEGAASNANGRRGGYQRAKDHSPEGACLRGGGGEPSILGRSGASDVGGGSGGGSGATAGEGRKGCEEDGSGTDVFAEKIKEASGATLAWYFRTPVYLVALSLVLGLTFTLWLAPCRIFPALINTARLVRVVRNAGASLLECIFLSRELVLNDGFSRANAITLHGRLMQSRAHFDLQLLTMRRGGSSVTIGADNMDPALMGGYSDIMYGKMRLMKDTAQTGCPWRKNTSDCLLKAYTQAASDGLYKYLLAYGSAIDLVADKYSPIFSDPAANRSSFNRIVVNRSRVALLQSDVDMQFLLENEAFDVLSGTAMLQNSFQGAQIKLLDQVHQEVKIYISLYIISVVVFLYALLFRTAMGAAQREIDKTRNFVAMIPSHVLTREDLDMIRRHFVGANVEEDSEEVLQDQDEADDDDEAPPPHRDSVVVGGGGRGGSGGGALGHRRGSWGSA